MPTRKLVTRYEDDLALFPDRYHKLGVAFGLLVVGLLPFVGGAYVLSVANAGLIAVVGAVGMMILTGFCGQVSLGHAAFLSAHAHRVSSSASLRGKAIRTILLCQPVPAPPGPKLKRP